MLTAGNIMIAMQADGLPYICLRRVAGNVPPPVQAVMGQVPNGEYVNVISGSFVTLNVVGSTRLSHISQA